MKTLKDLKRATDKFKEGMTKVRHSLPQHQALMKKIKKPTLSSSVGAKIRVAVCLS